MNWRRRLPADPSFGEDKHEKRRRLNQLVNGYLRRGGTVEKLPTRSPATENVIKGMSLYRRAKIVDALKQAGLA